MKKSPNPGPGPAEKITLTAIPNHGLMSTLQENLLAALIFLVTIAYLTSDLLLHPHSGPGGFDMALYFGYRSYWVDSLLQGHPAMWNPFDHLGIPYMACTAISAFSPFNLLFFVFPHSFAMSLETSLHIFLAAFGTYLFVRRIGAGFWGGLLSGFAFSFSSYFAAWSHAGGNLIFGTATWWPWILYHAEGYLSHGREKSAAWAAVFLALCFYEGHPQMLLYGLMMIGIYLFWKGLAQRIAWGRILRFLFISFGLFTLLGGIVLFQLQFLSETYRWKWSYQDLMTDLHSFKTLRYFIQPFFQGSPIDASYVGKWGYHEMVTYIGYIPLVLFPIGVVFFRKRFPVLGLFGLIAVLFILLSMGNGNPVSNALAHLACWVVPGFDHNRSLGRLSGVAIFVMSCGAGLTLDAMLQRWNPKRTAFHPTTYLAVLLVLLTSVDLIHFGKPFYLAGDTNKFVDTQDLGPKDVFDVIFQDATYPRIHTCGNSTANYWAKLATLKSFDNTTMGYMSQYIEALCADFDTPLSDLISLKYLNDITLFNDPPPSGRWVPMKYNYVRNTQCLPRAFVTGGYQAVKGTAEAIRLIREGDVDPAATVLLEDVPPGPLPSQPGYLGEAHIDRYSNNEVFFTCSTSRGGFFFFSDPYYPGWKAWVDGQPATILKANGAFRAVLLPSGGDHTVKMLFRPSRLFIALAIMLVGWALTLWFLFRKDSRTGSDPSPRSPEGSASLSEPSPSRRRPSLPRRRLPKKR